ncbi:MAG: hypothetical protein AAF989_02670 [Planctomycetota bacterium]
MRSKLSHAKQPRNARVIFGGMLALASLMTGPIFTTIWLMHVSEGETPDEMTVAELSQKGRSGNSLVRLTDADSIAEGELKLFGHQPGRVIRSGGSRATNGKPIVVRTGSADAARRMMDREGGLIGYVHQDDAFFAMLQLAEAAGADVRNAPELNGIPKKSEYPLIVTPINGTLEEHRMQNRSFRYAAWGCMATAILGLIIAGSGGPSIWPWFFFPGLAVFNLPGILLRYGRGGPFTRTLYLIGGLLGIGGAYWLSFHEDQILRPEWNPLWAPACFYLASFGGAACLGVVVNMMSDRRKPTREQLEQQMSMLGAGGERPPAITANENVASQIHGAATQSGDASLTGLHPQSAVTRYQDPHVDIADNAVAPGPMSRITDKLQPLDFEQPLIIDVSEDDQVIQQTIQVGCRNLVLAVSKLGQTDGPNSKAESSDSAHLQLFSVLDNGQVVSTISAGTPGQRPKLEANGGLVWVAPTNDPGIMLGKHLERTLELAQSSGTNITTLQPGEWRDVFAYVHRVTIDIGHQNHANCFKVYPSQHGRFRFPCHPVEALAPWTSNEIIS